MIDAIILALHYLIRVIPLMAIGVVIAELIIALNFTDRIAWVTKPITKFSHLPKECGVSFLTAFVSPASANSMLMEFYNKKLIKRKELIIGSLVNSFPSIVMHWRYTIPVILPLLGVTGLIYFSLLMMIGLIKTSIILIASRLILPEKDDDREIKIKSIPPLKEAFKISLRNSKKTMWRILIVTIPLTFIVFILIDIGIFKILADYLKGITEYFPIPAEGLPIIAAQFANTVAAWTIAGNLLSQGVLNSREIILTLLVGNILSSIIKLRFSIPYYFGIFGTKLGSKILAISTILRILIILMIIGILVVWW